MAEVSILLVSAGWVHPPFRGRSLLKQTLAEEPRNRIDEVATLAEAVARGLPKYDALVLYYHHRDAALSAAELAAFQDYVAAGGGVLAVHSATASYKRTPEYFAVLGGRFNGHGPVEPIEVRPSPSASGVFAGIEGFTVKDELYVHELQPDVQFEFETTYEGRPAPMVWTRTVGRGRVCYACPGHRSASMAHPSVQAILRRGLAWVARIDDEPAA